MFGKTEFEGNWEERYTVGPRIEIRGTTFTLLWRSSPVLETGFRLGKEDKDGKRFFILEKTGLRYEGASSDYATVEKIWAEGGALHIVENFPISGLSETVMYPTENSRYGNYNVESKKILPLLQGKWVSQHGRTIEIKKNKLITFGADYKICVLHSRSAPENDSNYEIVQEDPAKKDIGGFAYVRFDGCRICAPMMIFDAPLVEEYYTKEN